MPGEAESNVQHYPVPGMECTSLQRVCGDFGEEQEGASERANTINMANVGKQEITARQIIVWANGGYEDLGLFQEKRNTISCWWVKAN